MQKKKKTIGVLPHWHCKEFLDPKISEGGLSRFEELLKEGKYKKDQNMC
jgi:hypothetical protein